jgi:hypothetical protein
MDTDNQMYSPKTQKGQLVKCISKTPPVGLEWGEVYTVKDVCKSSFLDPHTNKQTSMILLQVEGDFRWHLSAHFALHTPPPLFDDELFTL